METTSTKPDLAYFAHKIRTPLSVIQLLSETALISDTLQSEVHASFTEILTQVSLISKIAEEMVSKG